MRKNHKLYNHNDINITIIAENQEEEITTEESSSFSPSPSSPSSSSTSSTSTAQSGGGGGWGGWFSSKITQASDYLKPVVNNTLNEYVRPTVS